ncbi:MAG: ATP-binding protein [Cyclobacteriaceae bacterium]|nr:ATP-binding protein [Cyclobacteriaceae bacterium]
MNKVKSIFFFLLTISCFININQVFGQVNHPVFHHVTVDDGLSNSRINGIAKDADGFIWFATANGLNRYDGYSIKVYQHSKKNKNSLIGNYVRTVYADNNGIIWAGTQSGLSKFNSTTDKFENYFIGTYIRHIAAAKNGTLWLSTNTGIIEYNPKNNKHKKFIHNPLDTNSISFDRTLYSREASDGSIWIASDNGLNRLYPNSGSIKRYFHNSNEENSISSNQVLSIYEDSNKNIWIGTTNGLNKYDSKNDNFIRYNKEKDNLHTNVIFEISEYPKGILWIGSYNGISRFNIDNYESFNYRYQPQDKFSLNDNRVRSIYIDNGLLWVGTFGNGVNKTYLRKTGFTLLRNRPSQKLQLTENTIRCILERKNGEVWVGTNTGIDILSKELHYIKTLSTQSNSDLLLSDDKALCFLEDSKGKVWIGTFGGGVNLYDPKTKIITVYKNIEGDSTSISGNKIWSIIEDYLGYIWIGTETGINRLDPQLNSFERHVYNPDDSTSLSNNIVFTLFESKDKTIWAGTANGLNKYNVSSNNFKRFNSNPSDSYSISHGQIQSIHQDDNHTMWIGTAGGLNKYDEKTEQFSAILEENGLSNNVIFSIVEDEHGTFWLSTNYGINQYNPHNGEIEVFYETDGLQSNEFNEGAYFQGKNDRLYFGGNNGLNVFYPDSLRSYSYNHKLVLTDFLLFNKKIITNDSYLLKKNINHTDTIILEYHQNAFSIDFSSLNYANSKKSKFSYKLEGVDEDWQFTDYNHQRASYTNISNGEYLFKVSSLEGSSPMSEIKKIVIIVKSPIWKKWWAIGIYIFIIISVIWLVFDRQQQIIRRNELIIVNKNKQVSQLQEIEHLKNTQNILLEKEVKLRTTELEISKRELEQNVVKLKESNDDLSSFSHIVSHDLKAPLRGMSTLISFISEDFAEKIGTESKKNLDLIQERIHKMYRLIEDLLHYSSVGKKELISSSFDLNTLLKELIQLLNSEEKHDFILPNTPFIMVSNRVEIEQVFQNLFQNAIKFCDKDHAEIVVNYYKNEDYYYFEVKDNGPGIHAKNQEKIFEPFKSLDGNRTDSSGLGLSIVKKIVRKNYGNISIVSDGKSGTTFKFNWKESS